MNRTIDPSLPLTFPSGKTIKHRVTLAPLTNAQSNEDGTLSDDELKWLSMRAAGGFSLTMTCASHVSKDGKGFSGQLGVFDDSLLGGLQKLSDSINQHDSLSIVQLHHAGCRSPRELLDREPMCPSDLFSDDGELVARGMSLGEIERTIKDFTDGAVRAERSGFGGVQIHAAHCYLITQFLSEDYNHRDDAYGGPLENRKRFLFEILKSIKNNTSKDFSVSVRVSPENYGLEFGEMLTVSQELIDSGMIDFLDVSIWDVFKHPQDEKYSAKRIIDWYSELKWGEVKYVVAGKIATPEDIVWCLEHGADFVALGKMGMLHHNYPSLMFANNNWLPTQLPVSKKYLLNEGLGEKFISYIANRWDNFIS